MYDSNGNFYKPERGSTPAPDHIMIAFCGDPKSEIGVHWRTDADTENGFVLYREAQSEKWKRVSSLPYG